jgi:capsular polysaccharide biosynthesis protein
MESYHTIYQGQFKKILVFTLVAGLLGGALTLLFPLKYSAAARLLVTQTAAFTLDPYTAIRSVELIGENLAQIIGTSSFFDKVLKSGYNIDENYFSQDELQRRKQWAKMVDANVLSGTGLLEIKVYHQSRDQASQIANAVAFLLNREGSDYMGRDISIRLVDSPIVSRYPVKPSIPLNILAGLFVGFLLGHIWVYIDHRNKKHHGEMF